MGVFSGLKQPQREDSLRVRLQEYVRLGYGNRNLVCDIAQPGTTVADLTRVSGN